MTNREDQLKPVKLTMDSKFIREKRYIVFKLSDIERYNVPADDRMYLAKLGDSLNNSRLEDGKPSLSGVFVERDWPEYEPVWKMIQDRMEGNAHPDEWIPVSERLPGEELTALRTRVEKLEAAWNAAVAFIDSHAADPDMTQEMVENYQLYLEAKEALAEQEENNGNQ